MSTPAATSVEIAEMIREDHLRLAVLLDLIEDDLAEAKPLAGRLAQLRSEYDRHTIREEDALARFHPTLLDSHRRGHDHMRALLWRLSTAHDGGHDIAELLRQVVGTFTTQLIPEDWVLTQAGTSSNAP